METAEDCIYSPYGRIGGILACLYLFATALYGAIFIYFPLLPLVLILPWHFRRAVEIMGSTYQTILVVCIFEKLCCDCRYTQYLNCKILHGGGGGGGEDAFAAFTKLQWKLCNFVSTII